MPPKKDKKAEPEPPSKAYKGVYRNKGLWRARVWDVDREYYLGHFTDEELAAAAYDRASIVLRGWTTAVREGLNLGQTKYKNEVVALENKSFMKAIDEIRAAGAQSTPDLKLK